MEGTIVGAGRRGRTSKQLLGDLNGTRSCWKLKKEALGGTVWKTFFGRGNGPVVGQNCLIMMMIMMRCYKLWLIYNRMSILK
jgi:hypothetical protein